MARMPDYTVLEETKPRYDRPIATYTPGIAERAYKELGDTAAKTGEDLAKEGSKLELAYAKSEFLRAQADAMDKISKEPDYNKYGSMYETAMAEARSKALSSIKLKSNRDIFLGETELDIARGYGNILEVTRSKERDTERARGAQLIDDNIQAALVSPDEVTSGRILGTIQDTIKSGVARGYYTAEEGQRLQQQAAEQYSTKKMELVISQDPYGAYQKLKPQKYPELTANGGFDSAMQVVLNVEGGHTPKDGASGAPAIFGINAKYWPEQYKKAKELADTQGEAAGQKYAAEFYKTEFWDRFKIDEVPAAAQTIVFDAAVNHRADFAKQLIQAAKEGKSPEELVQMREKEYRRLGESEKYAPQLAGWLNRLDIITGKKDGKPIFAKTGGWEDSLPVEKRMDGLRSLSGLIRSDIEQRTKDNISMAAQGEKNLTPISKDDFYSAYGATLGEKRFGEYQVNIDYAQAVHQVGVQTPAEQYATLEQYKPAPGENYADKQRYYNALQTAVKESNDLREKDPQLFARQNKVFPFAKNEAINPSDPSTFDKQLRERLDTAVSMQFTYNTPLKLFSNDEAANLTAWLDSKTSSEKLNFLQSMYSSVGNNKEAYLSGLSQIRGDSPVTAIAGSMISQSKNVTDNGEFNSSEVARMLLVGEDLLNPTKQDKKENGVGKSFTMPPDSKYEGLKIKFQEDTGNLFAGNPALQNEYYQAFKAYYAAEASGQGKYDGTYDDDIASKALSAILGNITEHNGQKILPPWGMAEDKFLDKLSESYTKKKEYGIGAPPEFDDAVFEALDSPGKYIVKAGTGYVHSVTGGPLIIDINE